MRLGLDPRIARLGTSEAHRIERLGLPARSSDEYLAALGLPKRPALPKIDNRAAKRAFIAQLRLWLKAEQKALNAYEHSAEARR